MNIEALAGRGREVVATLSQVIVGKEEVIERILAGLLANGHGAAHQPDPRGPAGAVAQHRDGGPGPGRMR